MDIAEDLALLAKHPDYRISRRLAIGDEHVFATNTSGEPCGRLAVIDTETTGLNVDLGDRIIDIAIATCEYGKETGTLYRVVTRFESLEDPEMSISPEITRLTGITDHMVKGQAIDVAQMEKALEGVSLVICHNATFDRGFLEARHPGFAAMPFACTFNEVPWARWGVASLKLDYLAFRFGLFNEAHRARADVDMVLALLEQKTPEQDATVLSLLLASARAPSWRIFATNMDFDKKDIAKAHGYQWHPGNSLLAKCWWIETRDEAAELAFLKPMCKNPRVIAMTARNRYRPLMALLQDQ